ncbi:hypothetical protein HK405_001506 [Cladochytrium tenue]|nr:hypothetical protein HK405_001506 [Cladochytrium tenue]
MARVERVLLAHRERLHAYNAAKDCAQAAIGQCAEMRGETVREAYARFGLEETD